MGLLALGSWHSTGAEPEAATKENNRHCNHNMFSTDICVFCPALFFYVPHSLVKRFQMSRVDAMNHTRHNSARMFELLNRIHIVLHQGVH